MYDDGCSTESCHTPNLVQSQRAVEDALMRNHRTWEQLPQGYQEVLGKTGWDPSTYDQSDLAKGGATDVSWSIEDPFNKLYWSVVGVTAGFEIAPLAASTGKAAIQQAIIACLMNPICQQIVPKAYSTRLEGQSDIFHNFPRLLDPIILKYGDKSINNGFVNFIIEGTVEHASKIYTGAYQIGIELQGLVPTIVHHFFKPK